MGGSGSEDYYYEDNRGYRGRGGSSRGYRANRAQDDYDRKGRFDKKKKDGEMAEKEKNEFPRDSADLKVEIETIVEEISKQEKVVEKADQECMEKSNKTAAQTVEKVNAEQHAKQIDTEKDCTNATPPGFINSFKPCEDSNPDATVEKANTQAVD